jgi:hypothetical protein
VQGSVINVGKRGIVCVKERVKVWSIDLGVTVGKCCCVVTLTVKVTAEATVKVHRDCESGSRL